MDIPDGLNFTQTYRTAKKKILFAFREKITFRATVRESEHSRKRRHKSSRSVTIVSLRFVFMLRLQFHIRVPTSRKRKTRHNKIAISNCHHIYHE